MTNIIDRLADLSRRGVELTAEDENLRFRAPRGALTPADRELLVGHKAEVMACLRARDRLRTDAAGPTGEWARVEGGVPPEAAQKSPNLRADGPHASAGSKPRTAGGSNGVVIPSPKEHKSLTSPPGPVATICADCARPSGADQGVTVGGRSFPYFFWGGERLDGDFLGFDTETSLIVADETPALALASASSGSEHCLIHPDQLARFILLHRDRDFVLFNCAFDYWVVAEFLAGRGEAEALSAWGEVVDDGRMHDAMLLDELIRLGRTDEYPRARNLAEVARQYAGFEVDKDDPYRLRYGEIIGADWGAVDRGFFDYAVKDAIATRTAFEAMASEAFDVAEAHGQVDSGAVGTFGPLSEVVQVQGAIALSRVSFHGMHLDENRLGAVKEGLRRRRDELLAELEGEPAWQGVVRRDGKGDVVLTAKTRSPSLNQSRLRDLLEGAAAEVGRETGRPVEVPRTAKGGVSLKADDWEELAAFHPVVRHWIELGKVAKELQFFGGLKGAVVHPRYTSLVRTGRTSCRDPNVQQLPRKGGVREAFIPTPGHLFLIVDYSFIELRTLAAVCEARYGSSTLADVIRDGTDPHAYTAAMFEGVDLETFMSWKSSAVAAEREKYDTLRQRAKVLNFGIPGGLGPRSLVAYARSTYGVTLTLQEATDFRRRLIEEVYPELGLYLADDGMDVLASNLGASVEACWEQFDWKGDRSGAVVAALRKVVSGKTHKADGEPYKAEFIKGVWDGLIALNRNAELAPLLARREGSVELARRLFFGGVTTLTGRVRGRVGFTQARNTPFQGLAADGAKLALWQLIRDGYRVVAFIHDEFVVELPEGADFTAEAERIAATLNRAMERVTGGVPVACEYALARCWSKKAKATFDRDGHLVPYEDGGGQPVGRSPFPEPIERVLAVAKEWLASGQSTPKDLVELDGALISLAWGGSVPPAAVDAARVPLLRAFCDAGAQETVRAVYPSLAEYVATAR
jgi:hypothetical protein